MRFVAKCLWVAGLLCFLAYTLAGSSVDEDGTLHEQFGLIPIGYLLILLGMLLWGVSWFRQRKK